MGLDGESGFPGRRSILVVSLLPGPGDCDRRHGAELLRRWPARCVRSETSPTIMPDPSLSGIERVRAAITELDLIAEIVHPGAPMPTVLLAAEAIGCRPEQIIKTVIFLDRD